MLACLAEIACSLIMISFPNAREILSLSSPLGPFGFHHSRPLLTSFNAATPIFQASCRYLVDWTTTLSTTFLTRSAAKKSFARRATVKRRGGREARHHLKGQSSPPPLLLSAFLPSFTTGACPGHTTPISQMPSAPLPPTVHRQRSSWAENALSAMLFSPRPWCGRETCFPPQLFSFSR